MKKLGKGIGCIWPMIAAYLCQIVVSAIGIAIYSVVVTARAAMDGVESPEKLLNYMLEAMLNADVILVIGGVAIAATLLLGAVWYKKYRPKDELTFRQAVNGRLLGAVVLLGIALQLLISMCLNAIYPLLPNGMTDQYSDLMDSLLGGSTVISIIVTVLLAPLAEEFLFRGVTLQKAKKLLPFFAANAVQALMFGIYHGNLIQGAYAFVLGMVLGYTAEYFHSIWAAVLLHACVNGSAQLLVLLPETAAETSVGSLILALIGVAFLVTAGKLFPKARTEVLQQVKVTETEEFTEKSFDE